MNNYFLIDNQSGVCKTWSDFLHDLRHASSFRPYLKEKDYYEVFLQLTLAVLGDFQITLLDNDFTTDEIAALTGQPDTDLLRETIDLSGVVPTTKEELLTRLNRQESSCGVTIYTSGTTGLPKQVTHTVSSLCRFVKVTPQQADAVWGFAYNPTHIAGIQVFFQALMNGNTIVRLFQEPKEQIFSLIDQYQITHISATPTFYRLLLPYQGVSYPSVRRITSGGEKFDTRTIEAITSLFPNAKVTNVYASTETGTLFAARGDLFEIKPQIADKVKIEEGELLIHSSLMGMREHATAGEDTWYRTGDLVELCGRDPIRFRFVSRKTEMINVGGYKVNPTEVEDALRSYPGVTDARVGSKKNSVLGNLVVAEVVAQPEARNEAELRSYLQTKLQEFKIPRVIRFVEALDMTRTGKVKRV